MLGKKYNLFICWIFAFSSEWVIWSRLFSDFWVESSHHTWHLCSDWYIGFGWMLVFTVCKDKICSNAWFWYVFSEIETEPCFTLFFFDVHTVFFLLYTRPFTPARYLVCPKTIGPIKRKTAIWKWLESLRSLLFIKLFIDTIIILSLLVMSSMELSCSVCSLMSKAVLYSQLSLCWVKFLS